MKNDTYEETPKGNQYNVQATPVDVEDDDVDLPRWKLIVAAMPWIAIQALWSTAFAVTTPYMKDLGLSNLWSSNIWIFGPITGFFTAPLVGTLSDDCTSKYGRRRPFIFLGLILLWASCLLFSGSKYIFDDDVAVWFAFGMFIIMDIVINVIQTPIRAIVADISSSRQQAFGQIMSTMFQGFGGFLGFAIMKCFEVPYKSIFLVMLFILSVLTILVLIQAYVAKEKQHVVPPSQAHENKFLKPFVTSFRAISQMSMDLIKIAFVQFCCWYAFFAFAPTASTWFGTTIFGGDDSKDPVLKAKFDAGNGKFSDAGLYQAALQIVYSALIPFMLLKFRLKYIYSFSLIVGAVVLILAKSAVGLDDIGMGLFITAMIAIPISAMNSFPFALVGAANKGSAGMSTGVQMGVLNIFICTPQLIVTIIVSNYREGSGDLVAIPNLYLMAGIAFALAGAGALFVNDGEPGERIRESIRHSVSSTRAAPQSKA